MPKVSNQFIYAPSSSTTQPTPPPSFAIPTSHPQEPRAQNQVPDQNQRQTPIEKEKEIRNNIQISTAPAVAPAMIDLNALGFSLALPVSACVCVAGCFTIVAILPMSPSWRSHRVEDSIVRRIEGGFKKIYNSGMQVEGGGRWVRSEWSGVEIKIFV